MTSILSWNVNSLFAIFAFYHSTIVTLDTQWQNTCNVLRVRTLHNIAWQQMNQIVKTTGQCVHHSVEPQPSVCHASDQQICRRSVGQDSPSRCHSIFEIIQAGNWRVICFAAEPLYTVSHKKPTILSVKLNIYLPADFQNLFTFGFCKKFAKNTSDVFTTP